MTGVKNLGLSPQGVPVAEVVPLSGARKRLAEHMMRSHLGHASFTLMGEVDVTDFEKFRREVAGSVEQEAGTHLSFTHFLVKVLAQSIRQHPIINSSLVDDRILILSDINIGVAVAIEEGFLVVPVIKRADEKSILEVAEESRQLADRARSRSLTLEDVTGGTFTLSNAGAFGPRGSKGGGSWSTPIITEPQSAILAMGAIRDAAVVRDGQIVIRTMLPTSLTVDHRVINGVPAGDFMRTVTHFLEYPAEIDLGL